MCTGGLKNDDFIPLESQKTPRVPFKVNNLQKMGEKSLESKHYLWAPGVVKFSDFGALKSYPTPFMSARQNIAPSQKVGH